MNKLKLITIIIIIKVIFLWTILGSHGTDKDIRQKNRLYNNQVDLL